jgi:phosphohistidine swiveling domain-containing protein
MNPLRFLNREDAAQPDAMRIGQEGFELARAAAGGLSIVPTFMVGTEVFRSYQDLNRLDDAVISDIISFAAEAQADELTIRPTAAKELIGLPGSERAAVERGHIRYLIERIYRCWNDPRARVHRETHHIPDDQARPAVIIQVPRSPRTLSLSTRDPRTGARTSAEDYKFNVNNRLTEFRNDYLTLMDEVEKIRRSPSQIDFQEDIAGLYIVRLSAQVISISALLRYVSGQHAAGGLDDIQVLSMLEPGMLGSAMQTSYTLSSEDSWAGRGVAASAGAASGYLIWRGSSEAEAASKACIFVTRESAPDDIYILRHCVGAFASRGGKTSHLAVVSRGLKIPAVTGIEELDLEPRIRTIRVGGRRLDGNFALVDGNSGIVSIGTKSNIRAVTEYKSTSPMSFINWIDELAQSVTDRGEFGALSVPMQTHIAALRRMIAKIRAGHD